MSDSDPFGHQPPAGWWSATIIGSEVFKGKCDALNTMSLTLRFTANDKTGRFIIPLNSDGPFFMYIRKIGLFQIEDTDCVHGHEVAVLFATAPKFNGHKRAKIRVILPFDSKIGGMA